MVVVMFYTIFSNIANWLYLKKDQKRKPARHRPSRFFVAIIIDQSSWKWNFFRAGAAFEHRVAAAGAFISARCQPCAFLRFHELSLVVTLYAIFINITN